MLHEDFEVNVNIRSNNGRTPMHFAAQNGQMEMVRMLHEDFEVDLNIRSNNGRTPMHFAAQNGQMEMVCYCTCHTLLLVCAVRLCKFL